MADIKAIIQSRHRIYAANQALWRFYSDCFSADPTWPSKVNPLSQAVAIAGGSGTGLRNYISRFHLETAPMYLSRVSRAVPVSISEHGVNFYTQTVGKPDSVITEVPDTYSFVLDDADGQGSSLLAFMREARTAAAVAGVSYVLVDSTKTTEPLVTEADVARLGVRPYLRLIKAEDLVNWRLDSNGNPVEILFRVPVESPSSILDGKDDADQHYEYRFWNTLGWQVYQEDADSFVLADEGLNPLGIVPLIPLYHRKVSAFLGESLLKAAAPYQVLLSNWLSSADQVLERQSFSQAVLKSKSKPSEVGIGTDVVIHLDPGTKDDNPESFGYESPSADPITAQWDAFARVYKLANSSMGLDMDAAPESTASPESGVARAYRFAEAEHRLVAMTENEQSTVRVALNLVARWKGQQEFPGSVTYSTRYDLNSVETDIQRTLQLQTMGLPPTAQRELMRAALKKSLPALPSDVQAKVDAELEQMGMTQPRLTQVSQA